MRIRLMILASLPVLALCGCPSDSGETNDVAAQETVSQDTVSENDTAMQEDTATPTDGVTQAEVTPGVCTPTPADTWIDCPGGVTIGQATALETLARLQPVAVGMLGSNVKWLAAMKGFGILRDGTTGTAMSSIFSATFCVGKDEVQFNTAGGLCRYKQVCGTATCFASMTHAFPTVDSDAAIATAFPDGQADAVYTLDLNYISQSGWRVTNAAGTTVAVPADAVP